MAGSDNNKGPFQLDHSRSRRNWDDEDAWLASEEEEYYRQLEEEAEAERHEEAIQEMEEWFHSEFEDPQDETPYDSETGEYQFVWGGPFDASEMLSDQFSHRYSQTYIDAAVERVERSGTTTWAPTTGGSFYEPPEPEAIPEARRLISQRILARLDEIDRQLAQLPGSAPSIGHNYPPGEVGLPPYVEDSRRELEEAAQVAREEVGREFPDKERIAEAETRFRRIGIAVLKWVGGKLDLAVDESIKAAVKAVAWGTVAALILGLADDIAQLLTLLGL